MWKEWEQFFLKGVDESSWWATKTQLNVFLKGQFWKKISDCWQALSPCLQDIQHLSTLHTEELLNKCVFLELLKLKTLELMHLVTSFTVMIVSSCSGNHVHHSISQSRCLQFSAQLVEKETFLVHDSLQHIYIYQALKFRELSKQKIVNHFINLK